MPIRAPVISFLRPSAALPICASSLSRTPCWTLQCLDRDAGELLRTLSSREAGLAEEELMRELRQAEGESGALLVSLADLSGAWSITEVTAALTGLADVIVNAAVDYLLAAVRPPASCPASMLPIPAATRAMSCWRWASTAPEN